MKEPKKEPHLRCRFPASPDRYHLVPSLVFACFAGDPHANRTAVACSTNLIVRWVTAELAMAGLSRACLLTRTEARR